MLLILIGKCQTKYIGRNLSFDRFWTCSVLPDHWRDVHVHVCMYCVCCAHFNMQQILIRNFLILHVFECSVEHPPNDHLYVFSYLIHAFFYVQALIFDSTVRDQHYESFFLSQSLMCMNDCVLL